LCSTLKVLLIHLQSSSHPFNCCAYIDLIIFEQLSYVLPLLFFLLTNTNFIRTFGNFLEQNVLWLSLQLQ
jgi:hypothetical protein